VEQSTSPDKESNLFPANRPEVIVDFIYEEGLFFIAVENIGDKPALMVSVRFEPTFMGVGGQVAITDLPLFKKIDFLAPHKSISTFLDTITAYFQRDEPTQIAVHIYYQDQHNNQYQDIIQHDLLIYQDIGYIRSTRDIRSLNSNP
jgi:hypothetical protein